MTEHPETGKPLGNAEMLERIEILRGDITRVRVDAIVNAANAALAGGGGVDGAIHRAAGPALAEACRKIREARGGCRTGDAVATEAGLLGVKAVLHAVGPIWQGGTAGEAEELASCYRRCVALAAEAGYRSLAFPNISTGVYGYPREEAARVSIGALIDALRLAPSLLRVVLVCYDEENLHCCRAEIERRNALFRTKQA